MRETEVAAKLDGRFDPAQTGATPERALWDWRAFRDTVTHSGAATLLTHSLTPTWTDMIDGQLRQVMLTPRELDIRQLPAARTRWINPHFIYTHGYGLVMAEANRSLRTACPFFIQDAPAVVKTSSLK